MTPSKMLLLMNRFAAITFPSSGPTLRCTGRHLSGQLCKFGWLCRSGVAGERHPLGRTIKAKSMAEAKTRKRRKLWSRLILSALAVVFIALFVPALLGSWQEYHHLPHIPGRVEVFIGVYPDIVQGQKASLLRLSKEIVRHPEATSFVIRRAGTVWATDDIDWWETIYDRQEQTIVDGNVWAGDTESWSGVKDTVVKKVVVTSDSFQGFGRSGCRNTLP